MKYYGIELEFFVTKGGSIVPAHKATDNLDGNPLLGELKTGVHNDVYNLVFELKKLIAKEQAFLAKKGHKMLLSPMWKVPETVLKGARADKAVCDLKDTEALKELSIYGTNTGKLLPRDIIKAALQINISDNDRKFFRYEEKKIVKSHETWHSNVFDFHSFIKGMDTAFKKDIATTKRVPGVFAIKDGNYGNRIEYRSLPNNINLDNLLTALTQIDNNEN
jgi:hypothetical protein